MLDEERRRALALRVNAIIDQAVRVKANTVAEARICFDGSSIYLTMSPDPKRWGGVSVLPGALDSIEWTLAKPSSLFQIVRRQPSGMALQVADALLRQLQVPVSARVHPVVCRASWTERELLELTLWEATEEHGVDHVLTSGIFRAVRSDDGDFEVIAIPESSDADIPSCSLNMSPPIFVNVARFQWWKETTEGDVFFDWDEGDWNPINAVATEILNEMTSATLGG